jgi:hypothetical protein
VEKKSRKPKKTIRICRAGLDDMDGPVRRRWYETARLVQQATNFVWQCWQQAMFLAARDVDLRIFLELYRRWKEAGDKTAEKPTIGFQPITAEWSRDTAALLADRWPTLHGRIRTLMLNATTRRILNLPSRRAPSLRLWQAVLLSLERPSCSEFALPIPFDRQNGDIEEGADGTIYLLVRTERFEREGKIARSELDRARASIECGEGVPHEEVLREFGLTPRS